MKLKFPREKSSSIGINFVLFYSAEGYVEWEEFYIIQLETKRKLILTREVSNPWSCLKSKSH